MKEEVAAKGKQEENRDREQTALHLLEGKSYQCQEKDSGSRKYMNLHVANDKQRDYENDIDADTEPGCQFSGECASSPL